MASIDGNEQALQNIADRILRKFGFPKIGFDPSDVGTAQVNAIDPLWAPVIPNGIPGAGMSGAQLGYLRYLSRSPQSALRVSVGLPAYTLTLDPEWTAPNARIGVAFGTGAPSYGAWQIMRPGETLFVPSGFTTFLIYNADLLDMFFALSAFPTNANLGFCRFLIGRTPGAYPVQKKKTSFAARMIHAQTVSARTSLKQAAAAIGFGTHNLKAIRVYYQFQTAAHAPTLNGTALLTVPHYTHTSLGALGAVIPPETETADSPIQLSAVESECLRQVISGFQPTGLPAIIIIPVLADSVAQLCFDSYSNALYNAVGATPATEVVAFVEGLTEFPSLAPYDVLTLYDFTGAAAAAVDTGITPTQDFETLFATISPTGAPSGTFQWFDVDDANASHSVFLSGAGVAAGTDGILAVGPGVSKGDLAAAPATVVLPVPIGKRSRLLVNGNAGSTIRVRIWGKRRSHIG